MLKELVRKHVPNILDEISSEHTRDTREAHKEVTTNLRGLTRACIHKESRRDSNI